MKKQLPSSPKGSSAPFLGCFSHSFKASSSATRARRRVSTPEILRRAVVWDDTGHRPFPLDLSAIPPWVEERPTGSEGTTLPMAVKVWSDRLQATGWVVADDLPKGEWPTDAPVYIHAEVKILKDVGQEPLAWVHATKNEIAKIAGVLGDTIHKAKVSVREADKPTKAALRQGERSIHRVYQELRPSHGSPEAAPSGPPVRRIEAPLSIPDPFARAPVLEDPAVRRHGTR